jgi:hypothetical protein
MLRITSAINIIICLYIYYRNIISSNLLNIIQFGIFNKILTIIITNMRADTNKNGRGSNPLRLSVLIDANNIN